MATSTQTNQKLRKANTISSGKGNSGPIRATVRYRLLLTTPSCSSELCGMTTGHDRGSVGGKELACNSLKDPTKEQRRSFSTNGQSVEVVKPSDRAHHTAIHRSSSFDTIVNYLNGEWPTTEPQLQENVYSADGSTQTLETTDHWQKSGRLNNGKPLETLISVPAASHRRSSSLGNGDNVRDFKARLAKSKKEGCGVPGSPLKASSAQSTVSTSPVTNVHIAPPKSKTGRVVSLEKHRGIHRHSRGSLEGINQEIEKMDLDLTRRRERSKDGRSQASGRCAPVKNLLIPAVVPLHSDIYSFSTSPPDISLDRSGDQRSSHDDDATPTNGYLSPTAALSSPLLTNTDILDAPRAASPKSSSEEDNSPGKIQFYNAVSPRKMQFEGVGEMLDRRSPDGCEKIEIEELENLSSKSGGMKILRPIPTRVITPAAVQRVDTLHTPLFMQYVSQPQAVQHHITVPPNTDQQYISQQCASAVQQYIISQQCVASAQQSIVTQQYTSQQCTAAHQSIAAQQYASQPSKLIFSCSAFQLVKKRTQ